MRCTWSMQERCEHLLNAEDEIGNIDQLLQRAEAVAVPGARARLKAAAHDAAADVDVRRRSVLVRQPQRILECPDLVRLIAPAQPHRYMKFEHSGSLASSFVSPLKALTLSALLPLRSPTET